MVGGIESSNTMQYSFEFNSMTILLFNVRGVICRVNISNLGLMLESY